MNPASNALAAPLTVSRLVALVAFVATAGLGQGAGTAATARIPIGVYLGNGASGVERLPAFVRWLGSPPERILDFVAYDSWASFVSDGVWTSSSWRGAAASPVIARLTLSVPLTIVGTPLAKVADGSHDAEFRKVARALVANGWGRATIRLGWEFNGSWMPWAARNDPGAYIAAYRRVVSLFRSAEGAGFTFDWCCAWGKNDIAPDAVYPGDDVVDIIGMDIYTRSYNAFDAIPSLRWQGLREAAYGLNWLVSFSREHHKMLSIPEWGTGEALTADGGMGGGDDPLFVTNMAAFLAENGAAYSDYWDIRAPDYNARVSNGEHPQAGAALRRLFGSGVSAP